MTPRLYLAGPLRAADAFALPAAQARHVQVLRLQPGDALTLFDGTGGEWQARVAQMGRSAVEVRIEAHRDVDREPARAVTLAFGMPANERMDALVEKATELGVAAIQPLVCERSVLRLSGERAERRVAHWQAVAIAACEQSGRTRVPAIHPVQQLSTWLASVGDAPPDGASRLLLHPEVDVSWDEALLRSSPTGSLVVLSGPEGGLAPSEVEAARLAGFAAVSLGPRVLRADTAPLAVLACCMLTPPPSRLAVVDDDAAQVITDAQDGA